MNLHAELIPSAGLMLLTKSQFVVFNKNIKADASTCVHHGHLWFFDFSPTQGFFHTWGILPTLRF